LPGPDNSKLEATTFGSGRTAAVFLHEAGVGADMCGFWPFARWLAVRQRVRVVLFNRCTYGRSTCDVFQTGDTGIVSQVQPAVDWARRRGARRIVLVGASSGASDALQAAGVVHDVAAVVDLSGDSADTGANDLTDARRVHIPALFAVAPGDSYSSLSRMRAVYRAVPASRKRLVIVRSSPGTHGWDLLFDDQARAFTPLATLVAEWVVGHRP
jgi:dienelactone hydrolase